MDVFLEYNSFEFVSTPGRRLWFGFNIGFDSSLHSIGSTFGGKCRRSAFGGEFMCSASERPIRDLLVRMAEWMMARKTRLDHRIHRPAYPPSNGEL